MSRRSPRWLRWAGWLCLPLLTVVFRPAVAEGHYVALPGGGFASVLPADGKAAQPRIAPFRLRTEPVTNAEFLAFVTSHPEWQREQVATVLADAAYLSHWSGPTMLGAGALPQQPVTRVSWFAAQAFCESEGARLPTWYEWEYAAAADASRSDARAASGVRKFPPSTYSRP